jgi:sugar phosphate permease
MSRERSSWDTRRVRIHYTWVVAAVTLVVLIVTAGIRATPDVPMVPLETEFGWRRTVISFAVAINIALLGLIRPFAASVIDRFGLRRVVLSAIALPAVTVALTTQMQTEWQLVLLWGVLVGTGTGASHQIGASIAALGAGAIRTSLGDYEVAFRTAGLLCVVAGLSFLTIGRRTLTPIAFSRQGDEPIEAQNSCAHGG